MGNKTPLTLHLNVTPDILELAHGWAEQEGKTLNGCLLDKLEQYIQSKECVRTDKTITLYPSAKLLKTVKRLAKKKGITPNLFARNAIFKGGVETSAVNLELPIEV